MSLVQAMRQLLEREQEVAALDALTAAVAAAEARDPRGGHVLLIEADQGLGTSALLRQLATLASERGVRVLSARAHRVEKDFAFGVVRQLSSRCCATGRTSSGLRRQPRIVVAGTCFAFVHPLIAEVVADDIAPARRQAMHRRAADYPVQTDRPAEEVAVHLLALPPRGRPETVSVLWRAAETARHRGATDRVVDHLRRAVAESSTDVRRTEILAVLGTAEAVANDIAGALPISVSRSTPRPTPVGGRGSRHRWPDRAVRRTRRGRSPGAPPGHRRAATRPTAHRLVGAAGLHGEHRRPP
ncbi:MAG: hypothetical protein QM619_04905 [Micropruina sp.]|uniref:hypothetical protein n=1 Tax=Micropruina sp. TaxID=2737536 RepID=UPI0039E62DBE